MLKEVVCLLSLSTNSLIGIQFSMLAFLKDISTAFQPTFHAHLLSTFSCILGSSGVGTTKLLDKVQRWLCCLWNSHLHVHGENQGHVFCRSRGRLSQEPNGTWLSNYWCDCAWLWSWNWAFSEIRTCSVTITALVYCPCRDWQSICNTHSTKLDDVP